MTHPMLKLKERIAAMYAAPKSRSRRYTSSRDQSAAAGPRTDYYAVEDACWIYQDRDLAQNLRRYGRREARRRIMSQGPLSKEWISHHGRPPVRLTRRGLEVKLENGVRLLDWQRMQSHIRARRS
jgi:hypothetical protein